MERRNWTSAHQEISNYVLEFSKASRLRLGGCVVFNMFKAKLKGKRGAYCRTWGYAKVATLYSQQNLTDSQCRSFDTDVYVKALTFVQNKPYRTVLNPLQSTRLFRTQTGQDWVTVIKAGGYETGVSFAEAVFKRYSQRDTMRFD